MANLYQYFVEGPCEESFLSAFMHDKSDYMIQPGKITIFNFLLEKFSKARALAIKKEQKLF